MIFLYFPEVSEGVFAKMKCEKMWFLKTFFNFTGDLITSHSSFWGLDINGVKKIQFDSALLY